MRLRRLDLERYGPFTGQSLGFRPDAALHIVYGRNEAGKSSALAAITDLLFGFETQSAAGFLHRYPDLRIGAEIETRDGATLSFRRRKGTRNTLIDAADTALSDDLLDPVLGGVSREVFVSAFGLSQNGLREGARLMLAAEGEIGESLFAAASGARGMVGVRDRLNAAADDLFAPRRATKRAFYEAQDRYTEAKRELRDRSLRAETLKTLSDSIATHEERLAAIAERLRAVASERSRLGRIRRVGPLLRRIDSLDAELSVLGTMPELPADVPERIEAALARAEACSETVARLEAEVAAAREKLGAMTLDDALLAAAAVIAELGDERAALAKAEADLPRRLAEARAIEEDLADHARRLGLKDRASLDRLQPDDLTIERARTLIEQRRRLDLEAEGAAKALADAAQELATLERRRAASPISLDIEPLRHRLMALRPAVADAQGLQERQAELDLRQVALAEKLVRLNPAADKEALWTAALPDDDAIAGHEAALAAHIAASTHAAKDIERQAALVTAARHEFEARLGATEALDADVLAAYRARRDASFDAVLATPDETSVRRYREEVAKADRLADARLAHADTVAQRDAAQAQLGRLEAALLQARAAHSGCETTASELDGRWRALFAPLGVTPEGPAVMRRWLSGVRQLREERTALAKLESGIAALDRKLQGERPALDALAGDSGIADPAKRSTATLLREVEERLAHLEASGKQARSFAATLEAASAARAKAAGAEEAARLRQDAFAPQWQGMLASLGLPGEAGPAESTRALDLWQSARTKFAHLADLGHRITSIREDAAGFAAKVSALTVRIAPGANAESSAAVAGLIERLARQTEARTRRLAAAEQFARQEAALSSAKSTAAQAQAVLERLAEAARCATGELAAMAGNLRAAAGLTQLISAAGRELAEQDDGLSEAALRREREGMDPDSAAAREQALETEIQTLNADDKALFLELGELKRSFQAFESGSGAAVAAQKLQDARTDLERIAHDYLSLKAAALLIGTGVERQLKAQQDPLVTRAGILFSGITEGEFSGIAVNYDGDDELRLAARRQDGGIVPVAGLSEGTCDQLYLALRLASLEAVALKRSVPPFIGDDLVVTFDEPRVAATLDTLAASGPAFQKILFTHHRHVVEIARERLGPAVDLIHLEKSFGANP